jgi:hypothetical protein
MIVARKIGAFLVFVGIGAATASTHEDSFRWLLGMALLGLALYVLARGHRCCDAAGAPLSALVTCRCRCHPDPYVQRQREEARANRPTSKRPVDVGSSWTRPDGRNYGR